MRPAPLIIIQLKKGAEVLNLCIVAGSFVGTFVASIAVYFVCRAIGSRHGN